MISFDGVLYKIESSNNHFYLRQDQFDDLRNEFIHYRKEFISGRFGILLEGISSVGFFLLGSKDVLFINKNRALELLELYKLVEAGTYSSISCLKGESSSYTVTKELVTLIKEDKRKLLKLNIPIDTYKELCGAIK